MKKTILFLTTMAIAILQACAQQSTLDNATLPDNFSGKKENRLVNAAALSGFYSKLKADTAQVRVLHIGDSHVRGHFLPGYVRKALEQTFGTKAMGNDPIGYNKPAMPTETGEPGLVFGAIGINGATTKMFTKAEQLSKITAYKPELIILSFGTNEGYGNTYNAEKHANDIKILIDTLRACCGQDVEFLLTTPPGCYKRDAKRQFYPNPFNEGVAKTIAAVAEEYNCALWDIFEIAGGNVSAVQNWKNGGYMQPDGVHYKPAAYELQGRLLGQAIAKEIFK